MPADIEATYRIVTPAFVGGADNKHTAELRLPSIKGALRFWWRTLAWSRIGNDVAKLWQEEAELFGSSDQSIGQSKVMLRLKDVNIARLPRDSQVARMNSGLAYLGYGLGMPAVGPRAGIPDRPALVGGGTFTLCIRLTKSLNINQKNQILESVALLGHMGGLGSRSRRGWGSLSLTALKLEGRDQNPGDLLDWIPQSYLSEVTPEWTAWSDSSRAIKVGTRPPTTDPMDCLDKVARELVRYRCWGFTQGGATTVLGGIATEGNFADDHDMVKRIGPYSTAPFWTRNPDRMAFGLPHNYYTQVAGLGGNKISITVDPRDHDRRASPLFLHVHQSGDNQPATVRVAFLPAVFLPGMAPEVTYQKNLRSSHNAPIVPGNFWWPIEAFFDRLLGVSPAGKAYAGLLPAGNKNVLQEPLVSVRVL